MEEERTLQGTQFDAIGPCSLTDETITIFNCDL